MRRHALYSRVWRQPWRYGLAILLALCVTTVVFSLIFLDELTPRLPLLPQPRHGLRFSPVSRLELQAQDPLPPPSRLEGAGLDRGGAFDDAGGLDHAGGFDDAGGFNDADSQDHVGGSEDVGGFVEGEHQHRRVEDYRGGREADQAWEGRGQRAGRGQQAMKILNDIDIEVGNASQDGAPVVLGSLGVRGFNFPVKEGGRRHRHLVEGDLLSLSGAALLNASRAGPPSPPAPWRQRWIVYLCHANMTCCGWGDRQHGILSAYVIALVTNRSFAVDMAAPCPLTNFLHPRRLDWRVNHTAMQGRTTKYIYSVNDKIFRQLMGRIDFDAVYPQDVVYLTTNYDYFYPLKNNPHYRRVFRQRMRGRPRPIVFADLFQNTFKLNKRVKRRLAAAVKIARPSEAHKLVCAHVRLGKNPTIPWDSEQRNTMASIEVLWQFFAQYHDSSLYRIFVASDSEMVRQRAAHLFPDQIVDVEGEIIHIDKLHGVVDGCGGFEKVIADQALLATCDVLVLTYSVFGKSAAYMRRSNEQLYYMDNGVISPLRLFKT